MNRAVQWHYIDKFSNETVPNHTFITTNHQSLFICNRTVANRTKMTGRFPVLPLKMCFRTFRTVPPNSLISHKRRVQNHKTYILIGNLQREMYISGNRYYFSTMH